LQRGTSKNCESNLCIFVSIHFTLAREFIINQSKRKSGLKAAGAVLGLTCFHKFYWQQHKLVARFSYYPRHVLGFLVTRNAVIKDQTRSQRQRDKIKSQRPSSMTRITRCWFIVQYACSFIVDLSRPFEQINRNISQE
jgi:hypothetical protein